MIPKCDTISTCVYIRYSNIAPAKKRLCYDHSKLGESQYICVYFPGAGRMALARGLDI